MSTNIFKHSKIDNFSFLGSSPHIFLQEIPTIGIIRQEMPNVRIASTKKAKSMGISLPPELLRHAKKYAAKQGVSFSRLVRDLLARELMEFEKK